MKDRIKELRKDSKMTQVDFGERIGVKGNTVTGYETGIRTPSDAVIKAICREFGCAEDWLRYGLEPKAAAKTQEEEITELVGRAFAGDNDFQQAVIRMICSRNKDELKVLEDAFRAVYESLK